MQVDDILKKHGNIEMSSVDLEVAHSNFFSAKDSDAADEFLSHYGVMGMRWGVRRDLERMDDGTLKKTIERMRLEQQYNEIADQSWSTRTKRFVGKHGERVFATALTATAAFAVKRALDQRFPKVQVPKVPIKVIQ